MDKAFCGVYNQTGTGGDGHYEHRDTHCRILFLSDETVCSILEWEPNIVLPSGPPLYLARLTTEQIGRARQNALRLAREADIVVLDHHLLRSTEGMAWLDKRPTIAGRRVICAADFMGTKRRLIEAKRDRFYQRYPVTEDWRKTYKKGEVTTEGYRGRL